MSRLELFISKIKMNIPVLSFFACYLLLLTGDLKINCMNINKMTFLKLLFLPVISLVNSSDTRLLFPVIRYNSFYNESKNEYMNKHLHNNALEILPPSPRGQNDKVTGKEIVWDAETSSA